MEPMTVPQDAGQLLAEGIHAHLRGESTKAVGLLHDAYLLRLGMHDVPGALQVAFQLAMVHGTTGHPSQFNGWLERSQRLLEAQEAGGSKPSSALEVAAGYILAMEVHKSLGPQGFTPLLPVLRRMLEIGRRHQCADLICLALIGIGRAQIDAALIIQGLGALDEAMVLVLGGECTPIPNGLIWCAAIEACQEIGAFERVCEWTAALDQWRRDRPGVRAFGGECALHSGQILALRGAWGAAMEEFSAAGQRFEMNSQVYAAGAAARERGDLLRIRGEFGPAELAYQESAEHGCDPQPGLALLWAGRGETDAAAAAVDRCLAERIIPARRIPLLPQSIEVYLLLGDIERAAELAAELEQLARQSGCEIALAAAAQAYAGLELLRADAPAALPYARKAIQAWKKIGCPYRATQSRVLLGRALRVVGDKASADAELHAAARGFESLGAHPEAQETRNLLIDPQASGTATYPSGLTEREVQVLRLVAAGHSNREIAGTLYLSEKTVARHLSNIFAKLDVGSRTAAAAWAFARDLL